MCLDPSTLQAMQAGASLYGGVADVQTGRTRQAFAQADAAGTRDEAAQVSERILAATARRRSAARAAMGASGGAIDEASLRNEREIIAAGETDAAMTILTGERRARATEIGGKLAKADSMQRFAGSLFETSYNLGKWRGAKGVSGSNDIRGVTGANAYDAWLSYGRGGD